MDTGPTGLYYRSDLFDEAGLPSEPEEVAESIRTWDALLELGAKLRADSDLALIANATMIFNQYINASPERYFDSSNQPLYSAAGQRRQESLGHRRRGGPVQDHR